MKAGLYFHIPFCIRKCRYCSFNSIPYDKELAQRYVSALLREMDMRGMAEPSSVYIGGGTPTVLPAEGLRIVLDGVKEYFNPAAGTEITIEANPGTLERIDFPALKAIGVKRISLGAQSFNPKELLALGRIHGPGEITRAVNTLREAGIANIGLDLIYSLPGQGLRQWEESIDEAVKLSPEHISMYDLSIEEGAEFYAMEKAGLITLPPEEAQVEMYLSAVKRLEEAGYGRYEISNFARPGYECAHNLNYWSAGDFIGFGAGAHSRAGARAARNVSGVIEYIGRLENGENPCAAAEILTGMEREREFIMLGLRKRRGLSFEDFRAGFGADFMSKYGPAAMKMTDAGYMAISPDGICLTMRGVLASNRVIMEFF